LGFSLEPEPGRTKKGFDLEAARPERRESVAAFEQPKPGSMAPTTLGRSYKRGIEQSAGLMGQLMRAIGDETGLASLVDVGDDLIQEALVEAISNPAEIGDLSEITSLSKGWTFLAQTFGEQIPNLVLAATGAGAGAGIGAFVTRAAVTRATLNNIAKRAAVAGLDPKVLGKRFFAQNPAALATMRALPLSGKGAAAGTFGAFYPINTGEILQEQRDASGGVIDPHFGGSLALGALSTSFEVLGFAGVARAVFGDAKKEVVEHMVKTVLRRVGHASLKSLAIEGGTEAVQEVIVIASKKLNDPTFSITDAITSSEGLNRIAFAGVSGAVVGAGLGGGGGIATGARDAFRVNRARADLRDVSNAGIDAAKNSIPSAQDGEVAESLFDIQLANKQVAKKVVQFSKDAGNALKAIALMATGAGKHTSETVGKGVAAAKERFRVVAAELKAEREALSLADTELAKRKAEFAAGLTALKAAMNAIATPAESSRAENKATHKTSKEIEALLKEFNALKPTERAAGAIKLLEKARDLALRAMTDPRVVTKKQLRQLINRAEAAVKASHAKTARDSKKYAKTLKVLRLRAAKAIAKIRVAEGAVTAEQAAKLTPEEIEEDLAVQKA